MLVTTLATSERMRAGEEHGDGDDLLGSSLRGTGAQVRRRTFVRGPRGRRSACETTPALPAAEGARGSPRTTGHVRGVHKTMRRLARGRRCGD